MRFYRLTLILLGFAACTVQADVTLEHAWARATPPGSAMGAVYGELVNSGDQVATISHLKTEIAKMADVHQTIEVDGMMRMREVDPLVIPAGGRLVLEPGGKHIMLMQLKHALEEKQSFKLEVEDTHGNTTEASVLIGGYGQMSFPQ